MDKKKFKKAVNEVQRIRQDQEIRKLYNNPAYFVSGMYINSMAHARSTVVRVTFTESSPDLGEQFPVCSISMSIENLQQCYDLMTKILQQSREQKRLD